MVMIGYARRPRTRRKPPRIPAPGLLPDRAPVPALPPGRIARPGAHTREVLTAAGFEDVDDLVSAGAVWQA